MKDTCKEYLKTYVSEPHVYICCFHWPAFQKFLGDLFGTACIRNYELIADMKVTRNQIYEYHSCYTGRKDFYFINRTLQIVKEIVSGYITYGNGDSVLSTHAILEASNDGVLQETLC